MVQPCCANLNNLGIDMIVDDLREQQDVAAKRLYVDLLERLILMTWSPL